MRADHAFDAESDSELSIQPGDLIVVLEDIDPGWSIGEILGDEQRQGMFPSTYCTLVDSTPASSTGQRRVSRPTPVSPGFKPDVGNGDVFADTEDQVSMLAVRSGGVRRGSSSPRPGIGARTMSSPPPNAAAVVAGKKKPPPPPPVSRGSKPVSVVVGTGIGGEVKCRECGCEEFRANVFKKGSCNNCFHVHIGV